MREAILQGLDWVSMSVETRRSWLRRWRMVAPLVLFVMILTRIVWLQLRKYNLDLDYRSLTSMGFVMIDHSTVCSQEDTPQRAPLVKEFSETKDLARESRYRLFDSQGMHWLVQQMCDSEGVLQPGQFIKINLWAFMTSVLMASFLVRLLTHSWVLAMVAGTVLLSRGHLLAAIGEAGDTVILSSLASAWMFGCLFFIRSGSVELIVFAAMAAFFACLFDPSAVALMVAMPILILFAWATRRFMIRPLRQRLQNAHRQFRQLVESGGVLLYEGGLISGVLTAAIRVTIGQGAQIPKVQRLEKGVEIVPRRPPFSTRMFDYLPEPFTIWMLQRRRWLRLVIFWTVCFLGVELLGPYPKLDFFSALENWQWFTDENQLLFAWVNLFRVPLDLHYSVSLIIVILCALQSPAHGLPRFVEASWLIIVALMGWTLTAATFDAFDMFWLRGIEGHIGRWTLATWGRASQILVWFEPMVLAFGVAGIYQLLVIGDEARQRNLRARTKIGADANQRGMR